MPSYGAGPTIGGSHACPGQCGRGEMHGICPARTDHGSSEPGIIEKLWGWHLLVAAPGLSGQVSFFVVAISPSQPLDTDLRHARTFDLEGHAPPGILVAHPDGRLANRDKALASAQAYELCQYSVANLL